MDDCINQYMTFHWCRNPGGIFKKGDTDGYTTGVSWGVSL